MCATSGCVDNYYFALWVCFRGSCVSFPFLFNVPSITWWGMLSNTPYILGIQEYKPSESYSLNPESYHRRSPAWWGMLSNTPYILGIQTFWVVLIKSRRATIEDHPPYIRVALTGFFNENKIILYITVYSQVSQCSVPFVKINLVGKRTFKTFANTKKFYYCCSVRSWWPKTALLVNKTVRRLITLFTRN